MIFWALYYVCNSSMIPFGQATWSGKHPCLLFYSGIFRRQDLGKSKRGLTNGALSLRVVFPLRGLRKPLGRKSLKNGETLQISPPHSDTRRWGKLRQSAGSCGVLRFPANICASHMLRFPGKARICKNQRKSVKIWDWARFVPFGLSLKRSLICYPIQWRIWTI